MSHSKLIQLLGRRLHNCYATLVLVFIIAMQHLDCTLLEIVPYWSMHNLI